jgi:hypothetical protein
MNRGLVTTCGIAMVLALAAPIAWSGETLGTRIYQNTTQASGGTKAARANPAEHPMGTMGLNGAGMEHLWGGPDANFVAHKIAQARAQGYTQEAAAAETQERMGVAELQNGMNREAADHFDAALLALGLVPNAQGQLSGEVGPRHPHVPGTNPPGPNAPMAPAD